MNRNAWIPCLVRVGVLGCVCGVAAWVRSETARIAPPVRSAKPTEVRPTQNSTGQAPAGQNAAGQNAAGQDAAGQPANNPAEQPPDDTATATALVQRGRYLVHHVAMCVECHSPRDRNGELIEDRLLRGAPMPVDAPQGWQEWCFTAPHLAGLPGWDEQTVLTLLQTGRRPDGYSPKPPMPPFRLSAADARAVVAYLNSLP